MNNVLNIKNSIANLFNHIITERDNLEEILGIPLLTKISVDEVKGEEVIYIKMIKQKTGVARKEGAC